MATYYDFVLGFIPFALLGVGGGLHLAGLGLQSGVAVGGLFAAGLIGHALFVNGPTDPEPAPTRSDPVTTTSTDAVTTSASVPMAD